MVLGTTGLGLLLGRSQRHRSDSLREPLAVLQAALLGVVGLILAFGLALAVGRYEARRGAVVEEANAIGTTYLRAQTLAEPVRSGSLERPVRYTDTSIALSRSVPGSPAARQAAADGQQLQRELWALAGQALDAAPTASAAVALGLLAFYLAILGRGVLTVLLAAALVTMLLLVTFDLDRPTRGLIRVPATPLTDLRASMVLPPAATGPANP